jgi:hypothetical protein
LENSRVPDIVARFDTCGRFRNKVAASQLL